MNKIFTLFSICAIAITANSQTYFSDDFEGGSLTGNNAWTQQIPTGTGGTDDWYWDVFSGDNFAENNVFPTVSDVWMISPSMDISAATQPMLSFQNTSGNFDGPDLEVYVSTVYAGGAINMGDWTQVTIPNLSPGSGDGYVEMASGDMDLTSFISTTTTIAFRYQSGTSAGQEYQIDDVLIQEGPTVITITPIYDIQFSTIGDSPELGNVVTTKGVVTGVYLFGSNLDRFFIQDSTGAWNGIYIYENGYTVAIGDSVLVTGEVQEFNSLTEIGFVSNVTILNSGNTLPAPVTVTSATIGDEEYEGVLVTLQDAICTTVTDAFGVWKANDGTAADIDIDDDLLPTTFNSVLGDAYDVTGIRHYAFGVNVFYPTTGAGITTVGFAGLEDFDNEFTIYPNPANNEVIVNAQSDALVAIYSMTGALVANGVSNKSIDISNLDAGIYQVLINTNGTELARKLVIQ
jgi:Secretion system C-terminal sorting domain